jgi:hypothetical protein
VREQGENLRVLLVLARFQVIQFARQLVGGRSAGRLAHRIVRRDEFIA